jgi:hypothetical protein
VLSKSACFGVNGEDAMKTALVKTLFAYTSEHGILDEYLEQRVAPKQPAYPASFKLFVAYRPQV